MALTDTVQALRTSRTKNGGKAVPDALQGVTKDRVSKVLARISLTHADIIDAVYALLDDETDSWFSKAPAGSKFSDGATTAHVACHVGILQRGSGKLDREGRDYWIKPLRDLGGIEAITLHGGEFVDGHVVAKSGNSCYRLEAGLRDVLRAPDAEWPDLLDKWAANDAARTRMTFQADAAAASRARVDTSHSDLITAAINIYMPKFLPGYQVVFVDDGDGDRFSDDDRERLKEAGIAYQPDDAMPDALLWNKSTDHLWVIEAVTSDGEVDAHKVTQMQKLATRCGKSGVGFTTVYATWRDAASAQSSRQNVAVGSHIWIEADPSKHFEVKSF